MLSRPSTARNQPSFALIEPSGWISTQAEPSGSSPAIRRPFGPEGDADRPVAVVDVIRGHAAVRQRHGARPAEPRLRHARRIRPVLGLCAGRLGTTGATRPPP